MSQDSCNDRSNFGHPNCGLGVFSNIVKPIFVPLKDDSGNATTYPLNPIFKSVFEADFYAQDPSNRVFGFPILQNFVWSQADTLVDEVSSGAKFFLREGVVSVTGELFNKDATPTMKGKIADMRCNEWGVMFVTNNNQLIGRGLSILNNGTGFNEDYLAPIPISTQSIDGIFSPTQDTTSQKIMFAFDLARNFDTSTLYMVEGDAFVNNGGDSDPINFLNCISVIDCKLDAKEAVLGDVTIAITDDFKQGFTKYQDTPSNGFGNVTGLVQADFILTNLDGGIANIITFQEYPAGVYFFTIDTGFVFPSTVKVELALGNTDPTYSGQVDVVLTL